MKIITLTTDFGQKDFYLSAYKGLIYKKIEEVTIVDISSNIEPFNLQEGVFHLKNAWENFPNQTLHQFRVGEEQLKTNRFLLCEQNNQFFLLPDNGVITMLFPLQLPKTIIAVENNVENRSLNDFLTNIIQHVLTTNDIYSIGFETTIFKESLLKQPIISRNYIRGSIDYVDVYGNLITNIHKGLFEQHCNGRDFLISFRLVEFNKIYNNYNEVRNDKVCFFNSSGYLQLSFVHGNASELYGLTIDDSIQIDFYDKV